jgi:transcriptional regulator with XRE-family HTH domain
MTELDESWQYDRAMSPKAFERAIRMLGISKSAAGRFFGVSESTLRRYLAGTADIPPSVVLLMRLMLALELTPIVPPRPKFAKSKPLQPNPDLT